MSWACPLRGMELRRGLRLRGDALAERIRLVRVRSVLRLKGVASSGLLCLEDFAALIVAAWSASSAWLASAETHFPYAFVPCLFVP